MAIKFTSLYRLARCTSICKTYILYRASFTASHIAHEAFSPVVKESPVKPQTTLDSVVIKRRVINKEPRFRLLKRNRLPGNDRLKHMYYLRKIIWILSPTPDGRFVLIFKDSSGKFIIDKELFYLIIKDCCRILLGRVYIKAFI